MAELLIWQWSSLGQEARGRWPSMATYPSLFNKGDIVIRMKRPRNQKCKVCPCRDFRHGQLAKAQLLYHRFWKCPLWDSSPIGLLLSASLTNGFCLEMRYCLCCLTCPSRLVISKSLVSIAERHLLKGLDGPLPPSRRDPA